MSVRPKGDKNERTRVRQPTTSSANDDSPRHVLEVSTDHDNPTYPQQDWRWYTARVLGRRHPYDRLPAPPPSPSSTSNASSSSSPPSILSTIWSSSSCPAIPEAVLSSESSQDRPQISRPIPIRTSSREVNSDIKLGQPPDLRDAQQTQLQNKATGSVPLQDMRAVGVAVPVVTVTHSDPVTQPGTNSATPDTTHNRTSRLPTSVLQPPTYVSDNSDDRTHNTNMPPSKNSQVLEGNTSTLYRDSAFCSTHCQQRYDKLSLQLVEAKEMMFAMSMQIEDQASQLQALMDENRLYGRGETRLGGMGGGYPGYERNGHGTQRDEGQDSAGSLEEKMMALQLQNTELRLCFERERRKREEAEAKLSQEQGYIRRLEDNVKSLSSTRVVMDPGTYREVAEAYIAARRTPTRTHNHGRHFHNSDLVCDHAVRKTVVKSSISLPTSPSRSPVNQLVSPSGYTLAGGITREKSQERRRGSPPTHNMDPWDYKQLLDSLEDIS